MNDKKRHLNLSPAVRISLRGNLDDVKACVICGCMTNETVARDGATVCSEICLAQYEASLEELCSQCNRLHRGAWKQGGLTFCSEKCAHAYAVDQEMEAAWGKVEADPSACDGQPADPMVVLKVLVPDRETEERIHECLMTASIGGELVNLAVLVTVESGVA